MIGLTLSEGLNFTPSLVSLRTPCTAMFLAIPVLIKVFLCSNSNAVGK